MNTAEIASAPAETWNQKNLPSEVERFEESPGRRAALLRKLPFAAAALLKRRGNTTILSLAVLGALGLVWYFYTRQQEAD